MERIFWNKKPYCDERMESLQKTNDEVVPFMLDFSKAAYNQEINWGH